MEYLPTLKKILLAGLLLPLGWACEKTPEVLPTMLDGDVIFDPNIYKPDSLLVSYAYPNPAAVDAAKPVIIACHGYTATTFEWNELRTYMGGRNDMYLSQVLLGGHGRTYEDFKNSTWKDWQLAITEEYDRLQRAGYTNLNFVCSSTSCPLILDLFASGYFEGKTIPANVLMVDPIVVSSAKSLSLIGVVGPMLGYIEAVNTPIEDKYWY
ncbi:MAG: esterase, partial [Cyclobacteriaceae bacterium]|nr:esterase [Cyclobacteriaceae bacterium]